MGLEPDMHDLAAQAENYIVAATLKKRIDELVAAHTAPPRTRTGAGPAAARPAVLVLDLVAPKDAARAAAGGSAKATRMPRGKPCNRKGHVEEERPGWSQQWSKSKQRPFWYHDQTRKKVWSFEELDKKQRANSSSLPGDPRRERRAASRPASTRAL